MSFLQKAIVFLAGISGALATPVQAGNSPWLGSDGQAPFQITFPDPGESTATTRPLTQAPDTTCKVSRCPAPIETAITTEGRAG